MGSAQSYELPIALQKHLSHSWCKRFPFCLLCPLEGGTEESVNINLLEVLHHSGEETTDPLLKRGALKIESDVLQLETVKDPSVEKENLENQKMCRPMVHEMTPLCWSKGNLCPDRNVIQGQALSRQMSRGQTNPMLNCSWAQNARRLSQSYDQSTYVAPSPLQGCLTLPGRCHFSLGFTMFITVEKETL